MFSLFIHDDVKEDLRKISQKHPKVAGRIAALLGEIGDSQDLLDRLSQQGFVNHNTPGFDVSMWFGMMNVGRNLWRLKSADLGPAGLRYRIIYAFVPLKKQFHVLGVVPRSFNYDMNHSFSRRILNAYSDL